MLVYLRKHILPYVCHALMYYQNSLKISTLPLRIGTVSNPQDRRWSQQRRLLARDVIQRNSVLRTARNNTITYHEFLPSQRRGSHFKSDNTHTIVNTHPLHTHILDNFALLFSSCFLFTVYPNRIMLNPTPLQVIPTRAREAGPKEHRAKQKRPRETHSVT